MAEVFQHLSANSAKMEPTLRMTQAEDIVLQGKDIAEYVTRQHTLDREEGGSLESCSSTEDESTGRREKERADEIRMAEIEAEAEDKKRADEIKNQMAKIEADKEFSLKEIEMKAQGQASTNAAAAPPPRNKDAKSPKLPSFRDVKYE